MTGLRFTDSAGQVEFMVRMSGRDLEHERTKPLSPSEQHWLNQAVQFTPEARKQVRRISRQGRNAA